jgi:collagen type I/II/III/V/XI/XXIV/XXVII alpha
MPNVDWTDPGTAGNWSSATNWTGLVGESYPGQVAAIGDMVTVGAANGAYVVTFDVPTATLSSLAIEGGNGGSQVTTLRMTAGNTLNIQGGVTLLKKGSPAAIDGAGTISVGGGITATGGTPTEGMITAGTDTTGGVLELTGTGFVSSPFLFGIGTAVPSTLDFNLAGGVATGAITIDNVNQTLEIGPLGVVSIGATQNVTNGTILVAGGIVSDTSGISFGTKTSSGSLSGFGAVTGALTMSGTGTANTITASGGNLTLSTAIGSNSGLVFAIGNTALSALQLSADPGDGNTFTFLGSVGELALTNSAASGFNDTIVGLNVGFTLTPTNVVHILGDAAVTVASGQIGSGTTGTVTLSDGAVLDLSGITNASGAWFVNTAPDSGGTGTEIFLSLVCYARGTMIQTPAGERPVEGLHPGMQVITLVDGNEVPRTVTWVGHRRIDLTRHPRPETVAPIRIMRDAFADTMPHSDLLLSPDHAVFVGGMLICIRQLVNGSTIRTEHGWTAVDYYHVELNDHAILLAEGLPAESYLDTGNRGFFANTGAPLTLYPDMTEKTDYPTREAGSCASFVWDEASVQPVWQRLFDRAAAIGRPGLQRVSTMDADLRLLADRHSVKPVFSGNDRVICVLPRGAREVRLVSRAQSPTEARPWLEDRRRLGVRVKRVVLRGADELREIPVDHPDLSQGWWGVERDGQIMSRWTDGEAVLPVPAMNGHVVMEIHLAGAMIYLSDAVPAGGTGRLAA